MAEPSTNKGKYIRKEIIRLRNRDPQDNFSILKEEDGKIKVSVHWTRDEYEILIIKEL